jgi:hypothetical protein
LAGVQPLARRLDREARTIEAMIRLYCGDHHAPDQGLCGECEELRAFALRKLGRCPFGSEKPTCDRCTVHCYPPAKRERIRTVMRYAGPRMLLRHPIMALRHFVDRRRETPDRPTTRGRPAA